MKRVIRWSRSLRSQIPRYLTSGKRPSKRISISVSDYGDKVRHEDLGEFAQVYAVCLDAGARTSGGTEETLAQAVRALAEEY